MLRSRFRIVGRCVAVVALGASLCGTASAQWSDDFDDYAVGGLIGQGDWNGWDLAAAADADVTDEISFSEPNSMRIRTISEAVTSDMVVVYDFKGGIWKFRAMTYVPSEHTGESYVILLNRYVHGGAKNWSTQIVLTNGRVNSVGGSDFTGTGTLPWIADEWVPIEIEIDLDANVQVMRYGDDVLDVTSWQVSGLDEIQAIDLYSNNGSPLYFDDLEFERVETPPRSVRTVVTPVDCANPSPASVTVAQPLAAGANPAETVTVTESAAGAFGSAQVTATNGGAITSYTPTPVNSQGYLTTWLLLGPFTGHVGADNPGCFEMEKDFLTDGSTPEFDIYPEAGDTIATDFGGAAASTGLSGPEYLNPGGVPTWNVFYDTNETVDFNTEYYYADIDQVMMYAFAYVTAEEDVDVDLCASSDDSIQILIDGAPAWCNSVPRGVGAGCVDTVPYGVLSAGEHTVMVKVFEGAGGHGFRFGLKAAGTSEPAPGITACLASGAGPCTVADGGARITWNVTRQQLAQGIGYTVDVDHGPIAFDGDVGGLRTVGARKAFVCTATDSAGYLTESQWLGLGPFAHSFGCGPDQADLLLQNQIAPANIRSEYPVAGDTIDYDPAVAATTAYVGPTSVDGKPYWRPFDDLGHNAIEDLNLGLGNLDFVMGWLVTYVEYKGAAPIDIQVCLGTDDGGQLWWDCDLLGNVRTCQGYVACNVGTFPVTVTPGVHRIAAAAWDNDGGWTIGVGLRESDAVTPIVQGDPEWTFHGRQRPAGYAPPNCEGCPPEPVTDLACVAGKCGAQDGIQLSWTNPSFTDPTTPTRIEVNGTEVATVASDATSACVPLTQLPQGVYEIAVIHCGGTPAVCSPFKTNALGQIRGSQWLVVGPYENGNDPCDGTGDLTQNQLAPSTIECLYPVAGDEVEFDLAAEGQASTNYVGPLGPGGEPVVEAFDDLSDDGDLNLDRHYGRDVSNSMSWMFTYVRYAGAGGQVKVCVGMDDGARVFLNDTPVVAAPNCGPRGDCNGSGVIDVEPGVYRIALGVWENNGEWGARLSLQDPQTGAPILDGATDEWEFLGTQRPPASQFPGGKIPCTTGGPTFIRGDANADAAINITDGIYVLNYLFLGGETPTCVDASDANDDGAVNITDGIYILNFLFLGGGDPPAPTGVPPADCGEDPTGDELDCGAFAPCA